MRSPHSEDDLEIKGPSYLYMIVSSFFIEPTAIDAMHPVYLGVVRQMPFLWCTHLDIVKLAFGEKATLVSIVAISKSLMCMKPPHFLH